MGQFVIFDANFASFSFPLPTTVSLKDSGPMIPGLFPIAGRETHRPFFTTELGPQMKASLKSLALAAGLALAPVSAFAQTQEERTAIILKDIPPEIQAMPY